MIPLGTIDPTDIRPLTDFLRNSRSYARRLKKTGRPFLLTVNGRAEVVVQDARTYNHLLNRAQQADDMLRLSRSLADVKAGRGMDAATALDELEIRHFGHLISRKGKARKKS